ncbi:hypothetical protein OLX02_13990 [Novosphingobium sp. KCTC 2891]|uniref:hypothetical protein n=2 Tax=unclassified Novosphingobium TaxID=2644732 RepID=UPI0038BCFECA|nr:hypothetical protein [Novosphingobium sp. KCTC 2891]
MKIVLASMLVLAPTQAQAGLGSLIKKQIQKSIEVRPGSETPTSPSSLPSPSSTATPSPAEPEKDASIADRFVTRQDAHGHDYDAKTGLLICLANPRKYKAGTYAMSFSETHIPEGHNPNLPCISADREYTKM